MSKVKFFRVANWEKLQHYKDRNPPWIKLHRELLTDYKFACLQDASKLHLILIWLLASQTNNEIPADPEYLKKMLHLEQSPNLKELEDQGFIEPASNTLADCKQVAMPETEAETETELKEKRGKKEKTPEKKFVAPTVEELSIYIVENNLGFNPEEMIDFYQSKNWMIGKNKMKDWRAAARRWSRQEQRDNEKHERNSSAAQRNADLGNYLRQKAIAH